MIELAGQVNKQLVKVLVNSGATGNFITDHLVDTWQFPMELETQYQDLKLEDGSTVQATRQVQVNLQCGDYRTKITARVFPNLQ